MYNCRKERKDKLGMIMAKYRTCQYCLECPSQPSGSLLIYGASAIVTGKQIFADCTWWS